jgi:glycosyltransferase involved in cell wall biosynthesis
MLVTIGIPTYNRADSFLKEALESALRQTYSDLEIIVADNCSTDHTEELVKGYNDDRIRYIRHEKPLKPYENFNFCAYEAKGEYFLLLHDDDVIDPDFVETCMHAANNRKDYGFIRTGMRRIDAHGEKINERQNLASGLSTKEFFQGWFEGGTTPMHLCCTLFNTKGLQEVGGFISKTNLFLDVVPEVKLAAKYGRLDIKSVKASFRKHSTNLAKTGQIKDWCEDSLYLFKIMSDLVGNHDKSFEKSGMHFFAGHCYRYARTINSPWERIAAYGIIYKSFDYSASFFMQKLVLKPVSSFVKRVKRKITRIVNSQSNGNS